MIYCFHESCGNERKVWLPEGGRSTSDVLSHPWCIFCGIVQNISDDRPKKVGYWINVLSWIAKRYSLKQSQIRLVANELESHECFHDLYSATGSSQREVFIKIITRYCDLPEKIIDSYTY